jgi:hypothetical protein
MKKSLCCNQLIPNREFFVEGEKNIGLPITHFLGCANTQDNSYYILQTTHHPTLLPTNLSANFCSSKASAKCGSPFCALSTIR